MFYFFIVRNFILLLFIRYRQTASLLFISSRVYLYFSSVLPPIRKIYDRRPDFDPSLILRFSLFSYLSSLLILRVLRRSYIIYTPVRPSHILSYRKNLKAENNLRRINYRPSIFLSPAGYREYTLYIYPSASFYNRFIYGYRQAFYLFNITDTFLSP